MTYTFNCTALLNEVCQDLGLSDSYAELQRQGYDMAAFIGSDDQEVRKIFEEGISEDLEQFSDNLEDLEFSDSNVAIRLEAAKKLGYVE